MTDADAFDLIPAYALDALPDEERRQVEALLAASADARAELRTCQEMMGGMAMLAPRQRAPAHLTDAFRARLAEAPQVTPPRPHPPYPTLRWANPRRVTRLTALTALTALVGLAAVITLVVGAALGYRAIEDANRQRLIDSILASRDAQWIALEAQEGSPGRVQFVLVPGQPEGVLVAQLPDLPQDRQYQLWMRVDETRFSLAVFSRERQEDRVLCPVPEPGRTSGAFAMGITVEPRGGSPAPTTSAIFRVQYQRQP
jgi:anti-sigma-K factor RskA